MQHLHVPLPIAPALRPQGKDRLQSRRQLALRVSVGCDARHSYVAAGTDCWSATDVSDINYVSQYSLVIHTHTLSRSLCIVSSDFKYFVSDAAYHAKQRGYHAPDGVEFPLTVPRLQQLKASLAASTRPEYTAARVLVLWPVGETISLYRVQAPLICVFPVGVRAVGCA